MPVRFVRPLALLIALLAWCPAGARAQENITPVALESQIVALFQEGEYARALKLIESHLAGSPRDVTMLYNAACACSRLGEFDRALDFLTRAIEAGFVEFDHMERDPDLAALRERPGYRDILALREEAHDRLHERLLESARAYFGEEDYRYETDEAHRIHFVTALDERSHREMRTMLRRQADYQIEHLFGAPPDYFILLAIPSPEDAAEMFSEQHVGGIYEHPRRRLVARGTGYLLRHEFTHVLHFGHMERLDQDHPLWIEEGLASLFEDYTLESDGSIRFTPNSRHNIAKRAAGAGVLTRWRELFAADDQRFMAEASRHYPQVRSIFRFLAERGHLDAWYRAYVEGYENDPTGAKAFETVFGRPLEDVERAWRLWLAEQPLVDDTAHVGDGSLGIQTGMYSANDGVVVRRFLPGSGARQAGMRVGDVIVGIDGRDVRSFEELSRALGGKAAGEVVRVRFRRGGEYLILPVRLTELRLR